MATVPGVLLIGGFHIQGGNPGMNAVANGILESNLRFFQDRDLMRIVPDNPANGGPTADSLSCWPWYDGGADTTFYTVASSSTTTITVSGTPWTTNQWAGRLVSIRNTSPLAGVGFAQRFAVTSNTNNTLTFAATTAPTVGATFILGLGRFTDYHPVGGWLDADTESGSASTRGGSSWQTAGNGVGPDATMVRKLLTEVYPTAPYFHLAKWGDTTAVATGWADTPNDSARANFLLEMTRIAAAATARGNTIAWGDCLIDLSENDVVAAISAPSQILLYEARLRQMIAWLRSSAVLNNANARIVLVNHRVDQRAVSAPAATPFVRAAHLSIARDTAGVGILEMEGRRVANSGDAANADKVYYAQQEYFYYGEQAVRVMQQLSLGAASTVEGGFPVYLILGDSIMIGEATANWTSNSNSPSISGPTVGSLLRPSNQLIWNRGTGALEVYLPHTNSNTSGSSGASSFAGPDLSILAELGLRHPDGFAVVKRASYAAALATQVSAYSNGDGGRWIKAASQHYSELLADYRKAAQYINEILGRQVDVRGAFVSLGHNDSTVEGGGATFAANVRAFCDDLWRDFGTRTSGRKFPVAWRRPQPDAAGAILAEVTTVRTSLAEQAVRETQFRVIDVDGLERDRDDRLHETPETAVITGRRMTRDLQAVAI